MRSLKVKSTNDLLTVVLCSIMFAGMATRIWISVLLRAWVFAILIILAILSLPLRAKSAVSGLAFSYILIDANPPSGSGCCLDVLALGDLDGDNQIDILVGSENSSGMVWYHYPSWTRYYIGSGNFTTDGEIVDVDGDGDMDIVISEYSPNNIEWWENEGNPFITTGWERHLVGNYYAHDLVVADINSDNNPDIVKSSKGDPGGWYEAPNDPRGTWTFHSIAGMVGEGLDAVDIDGDLDVDIASSRYWFENTHGNGLTWVKHTVSTNWLDDCRDIIVDLNNDNMMDIVLTHSEGSGRVSWFENPTWTEHPIESGILEGAHSLELGDFDNDGDLDLMTGEMHTSATKRVLVYENLGGGTAWSRTTLVTSGTHNARIADIDGDGDMDIVGKNYAGVKVVEMWVNTSTVPTPQGTTPPGTTPPGTTPPGTTPPGPTTTVTTPVPTSQKTPSPSPTTTTPTPPLKYRVVLPLIFF